MLAQKAQPRKGMPAARLKEIRQKAVPQEAVLLLTAMPVTWWMENSSLFKDRAVN
jgi:hypothetical protein